MSRPAPLPFDLAQKPMGEKPSNDANSSEFRKWQLSKQNPGKEIVNHPGSDPDALFKVPYERPITYLPDVIARRPDWIACAGFSNNARIADYLFPLCDGPRGRGQTYFGMTWPDILCSLYDLEGCITQHEWASSLDLLNLLRYFLAPYEDCVFIFPEAVTDVGPVCPVLRGDLKTKASKKRFWVLLCHRRGNHWAMSIYDQVKETIFFFDSMSDQHEADTLSYVRHIWVVIAGSSLLTRPNDPRIYNPKCPAQTGAWECGI